MPELKTKPTRFSVASHLAAIDDAARRRDCKQIVAIMRRVTGEAPRMWGPSIVGFGSYRYRYGSGHAGEWCVVGFTSRKTDLSIHLLSGYGSATAKQLLAKLGPHKTGKSCLYLKRLADVDLAVLERLVAHSVADTRKRFPDPKDQ